MGKVRYQRSVREEALAWNSGTFITLEKAARAYDAAARLFRG